jgi:hypothetical protein
MPMNIGIKDAQYALDIVKMIYNRVGSSLPGTLKQR